LRTRRLGSCAGTLVVDICITDVFDRPPEAAAWGQRLAQPSSDHNKQQQHPTDD